MGIETPGSAASWNLVRCDNGHDLAQPVMAPVGGFASNLLVVPIDGTARCASGRTARRPAGAKVFCEGHRRRGGFFVSPVR